MFRLMEEDREMVEPDQPWVAFSFFLVIMNILVGLFLWSVYAEWRDRRRKK